MPPAPVVVCIGGSPSAQKLIAAGAEYARETGAPLKVLHVTQSSDNDSDSIVQNSLALANLLDAEFLKIPAIMELNVQSNFMQKMKKIA